MSDYKQEIIDKLKEKGYNAINEQGVITILCNEKEISVADCMKLLKEEMKLLNYNQLYGVRAENTKTKEVKE